MVFSCFFGLTTSLVIGWEPFGIPECFYNDIFMDYDISKTIVSTHKWSCLLKPLLQTLHMYLLSSLCVNLCLARALELAKVFQHWPHWLAFSGFPLCLRFPLTFLLPSSCLVSVVSPELFPWLTTPRSRELCLGDPWPCSSLILLTGDG